MDMKVKVIKMFNDELGFALNNLQKIEQIHENLQQEKNKVEECLSLASSKAPSNVQEAVEEVSKIAKSVEQIKQKCENICTDIEKRLEQEHKTTELQNAINDVTYLERSSLYLQFVKFIQDLSTELEVSLLSGNDEACVSSFVILKESFHNIENTWCNNLKNYTHNVLYFWYEQIKKKLVLEYNEVLKALKWPFCGNNANAVNSYNHEAITRFKIITEHLLHIQLPNKTIKEISTDPKSNCKPLCLPVTLLVHPLKQRFIYHFTGIKKTNRRDKPEWFFTQILTWIRSHSEWLEKYVQSVADVVCLNEIDVKEEFMRALVQLAVEKLHSELCIVQYDDSLFAHTIDEALGFERELRNSLLYPSLEPTVVSVLIQPQIFIKWITMEKKYAAEKMDAILSSDTAWSRSLGHETDELKVTECAEAFLTLLSTISDRYNLLPQPGHRLQFLDLQLELIDDFRVRLLQLLHENYKNPLHSLIPLILNTLRYISIVLQNWGITVPFLKLYYFKNHIDDAETMMQEDTLKLSLLETNDENLTVFDEAISLLQRFEKKLMTEISDSILMEITAKSKPYCNEKWFSMPSEKNVASLSVTTSGCAMFQEIANQLHALHNALALTLFEQSVKNIAIKLDQFLLDELILPNQFNTGGCAQIQFDIERNLLPLFGLYTNKIEHYFCLIIESCILLNMLPGSAILLVESLETEQEDLIKEILIDVHIYQLSPLLALKILKTRMDISTGEERLKSFEID